MQADRPHAQFVGRLDGHHIMSQRRKPSRIAPRSRTDIQNPARNRRDQMQKLLMEVGKGNAFISLDERSRFLGIALRAAHPNRHRSPPAERCAR